MTSEAVTKLREHLATINDLHGAMAVLGWDELTKMPTGGAGARGERMATLGRLAHEMFIADETGRLIEAAENDLNELDFDSDEASLVRFARRGFDRSRVISPELLADAIRARTSTPSTAACCDIAHRRVMMQMLDVHVAVQAERRHHPAEQHIAREHHAGLVGIIEHGSSGSIA